MLFLLSLFATALAAPQLPYYGYTAYNPYAAYPAYAGYQAYPGLFTSQQALTYQKSANPMGRTIVSLGNFLELTGDFAADATATPARTITGNFVIQQNPLLDITTAMEAKMNLYVRSTADLNGKELRVRLGTGADCNAAVAAILGDVAAVAEVVADPTAVPAVVGVAAMDAVVDPAAPVLASLNGPIVSFNGFYINGRTTGHNINGLPATAAKAALTGADKWLLIQEGAITTTTGAAPANIIGCSAAALV